MSSNEDSGVSKRYIVFANERGTRAKLVQYEDPEGNNATGAPDDFYIPVGIVYHHPPTNFNEIVGKYITGNPDISELLGKILTIADALFIDREQRNAFKSLLRNTIYGYANDREAEVRQIYALASGQSNKN